MKLAARIVSLAAVVNLIVAVTSLSAAEPAFNWERVTEGAPGSRAIPRARSFSTTICG